MIHEPTGATGRPDTVGGGRMGRSGISSSSTRKVRSVDARDSVAEAVLVSGGPIAAVGTETEVRASAAFVDGELVHERTN